jgi:hypothetical protein
MLRDLPSELLHLAVKAGTNLPTYNQLRLLLFYLPRQTLAFIAQIFVCQ